MADESEQQEPQRRRAGGRPKVDPEAVRGTVTGYVNHGLRDEASRAAWAAHIRERRRAARARAM